VLSLSRITLENHGKIRPQPDRENAFAGASGGADATGIERSPSPNLLLFIEHIWVWQANCLERDWQPT